PADAMTDRTYRPQALAGLAPHLPPPERRRVLAEVLAVATAIPDEQARARALAALALQLPAGRPGSASPDVPGVKVEDDAEAVTDLAGPLAAAIALTDNDDRARAITVLAAGLPAELLPEALAAAATTADKNMRAAMIADRA